MPVSSLANSSARRVVSRAARFLEASQETTAQGRPWRAVDGAKAMDGDSRSKHSGGHEDRRRRPLVSVIVPTHNRPETLAEALQSIVTQTYSSIEIIVINDGGRDVKDVVRQYASQRDIRYIHLLEKKGRSAARNVGI